MAKTPLDKQIEKARKEAQKNAYKEELRQRAASIVSSQPIINGVRIIDDTAETVLNCLLENCKDSSTGHVSYDNDIFPQAVSRSIGLEIEKLIQYGMVTSYIPWANGGMLNLLPCSFSYFERKATAQAMSLASTTGEKVDSIIFISHRSTDKDVADMLVDFFCGTGIPRNAVFCSSLPGNDINEKISGEVKTALKSSAINVAILSHSYYESAYCLNEAGVLWYRDDVPVIPIALPEITSNNMFGFLNNEYKLRCLDSDDDISYIYDAVSEAVSAPQTKHSIITRENQKLRERYVAFLGTREIQIPVPTTTPAISTAEITTDDERIVLYYILKKNVRKVSKAAIYDWLNKSEIYDVDIDNAFDLLSSLAGGTVEKDTLEFGIEAFRKYSANAASVLPELKECVVRHTKLAINTFKAIWSTDTLDPTIGLFIAYIIDERMSTFGDRWKADGQIASIKQWESKNTLDDTLSKNYGTCLEFLVQNNFVYASEWTGPGNVRQFTLCPSLQEYLFNCPAEIVDELQKLKNAHYCDLPF